MPNYLFLIEIDRRKKLKVVPSVTGLNLSGVYQAEEVLRAYLKRHDFPRPQHDETYFLENSYAHILRRLAGKA